MLTRWLLGLPLATAVVMVLALIMTGLISQEFEPAEAKPPLKLTVTPQIEPTKPTIERRPTEKLPEAPPEPATRTSERTTAVTRLPFERPTGVDNRSIQINPGGAGAPIIRVAPPYPEACASKGIEGVVLVQFDVTAEGNVVNAQIISSPNPCFNRAVIRAVSGWKYAPAIRDGRPMARYGVTERLVFELKK